MAGPAGARTRSTDEVPIERRKDGAKELVPLEDPAKWVKDALEKDKGPA